MQVNLFGEIDHGFVDRYAGLGVNQRYKKLVSKSNVDMVLNRFSPFTKVRNLKNNTSTNISLEGTNIEGTGAPVTYHHSKKSGKIYVNSDAMEKHLDELPLEDREDRFKLLMRGAYTARADVESINARTRDGNKLGNVASDLLNGKAVLDMSLGKIDIMKEMHRQILVAAQQTAYDCHIPSGTAKMPDSLGSDVGDLSISMANGTAPSKAWAQSMMDRLHKMGRNRGEYNKWADDVLAQARREFGSKWHQEQDEATLAGMLDDQSTLSNAYYMTAKDPDEKDSDEACEVGHGKMKVDKTPGFSEEKNARDEVYEEINDTLEMDDISDSDKKYFFNEGAYGKGQNEDWNKRDSKMSVLADALYDTLCGKVGKRVSQNPAKRLNTRALASGLSDNIYKSKVPLGGKNLSLNLILDTSGSMASYHITDGVDVINCINKLALRGVISGNLMLTASGASSMFTLPINPDLLPKISAHNGGEGFRHTMGLRWKELQAADYNVAITDGMLTDGHIDQHEMKAQGIEIVGLYTQRNVKKDPKLALSYTNGLNKWFTKSAVRGDASELIYYLIDNAILSYDMNPRSTLS